MKEITFVVSSLDTWGGAEVVLRDFVEEFGGEIVTTKFSPEVLTNYFGENPEKVVSLVDDEDYLSYTGMSGTDYESSRPSTVELMQFRDRVSGTKRLFEEYLYEEHDDGKPVVPLSPLAALFVPEEYRKTAFLHSTFRIFTDLYEINRKRLSPKGREQLDKAKQTVGEEVKEAVQDYKNLVVNSEYVYSTFEDYYDVEPDRIAYPGPDMEKFKAMESTEDYFLAVQRLDPYKRLDILLKAFSMMPDEKLVLVGDGEQKGYVKKAVQRTPNIEYREWVQGDELVNLYRHAKATIQTCQVEDFGKVPVESMACGTPVIATNRGGFKETVTDDTGVLFELDSKNLVDCVKDFNRFDYDYTDCRERAEKFSKEQFLNVIGEEVEKL